MNNAAASRQATQVAQKENAKAKVSKLLAAANAAIGVATRNGEYQAAVRTINFSLTEVTLVMEALRKLGYVVKKASQEPFIDVSW